MRWSRRRFLGTATAVAASGGALLDWIGPDAAEAQVPAPVPAAPVTPPAPDQIPRRPFGRTGVEVSALGMGGFHVGAAGSQRAAVNLVQEAIDAGVTFLDNAWEYHGGRSEEWMGAGIAGRRDRVFLMTKVCTHGRGRKDAMAQLEESLRRLRTDHLDLWQVHEVIYDDEPARAAARDGVLEALEQAKREGKTRFVGFTGHKDPRIHLDMLRRDFPFDACQMPLNVLDGSFRSFEREVLPECTRRGIAVIGMKSLGGDGGLPRAGIPVDDALRYAMSLPVATTVSGMENVGVLSQNVRIAKGFVPLPEDRLAALRARWATLAGDGHLELYKTSMRYDGKVGRTQHGFPGKDQLPT